MREYKNLPHPTKEPEAFNQYLRDNNEVLAETDYWIVIRNSFIKDQLVAFCKLPVATFQEYALSWTDTVKERNLMLCEPYSIMGMHKKDYIYINAEVDKSVPDRLHFHIKLSSNE